MTGTLVRSAAEDAVAPFIDNSSAHSDDDARIEVINPSNGQPLLSIPAGSQSDVDRAVSSSRAAFETGGWSEAPPSFRKAILQRFAALIQREAPALDALDAGEMGKPVKEPLFNAEAAAECLRFYAEAVDKVTGDAYGSDRQSLVLQRRVPRGVVGAIIPWNFPTYNAVLKLAPALAAGNCVVLKPSELASRSACRLAQLGAEAGLPPGVLNLIPGAGSRVGRALALHGQIDMLTFTGSTAVGKKMLEYAGQSNMKVVLAECGGKSPHIVFAYGVDLDAASDAIAQGLLTNQSQICSAGTRILVHRSVEQTLLAKIAERASRVVIGDALDPGTTFGPLASRQQCARVMQYIESAASEGAQLLLGGRRVLPETGGYFVEPTIFANVAHSSRLAQEEIFGPVLSVIPFDDESDAVRMANGTRYGLMAYVWTRDLSTGLRLAKSIRSSVIINAAAPAGEGPGHACSLEPTGQSGMGVESGLAGMESYLRRHLVWFNHS